MTVAIVTGGESGIGAATAIKLAESGSDVVITYYKDGVAADRVVEQILAAGRRGRACQTDVGDEASV